MGIRSTFAGNLRRLRAEKEISQEELADRANIDRTYISILERQINGASIDVVERLAKGLGVYPSELLLTKSQRRKS
jgi:transcriptional regulator with XRE-family HTH domain